MVPIMWSLVAGFALWFSRRYGKWNNIGLNQNKGFVQCVGSLYVSSICTVKPGNVHEYVV